MDWISCGNIFSEVISEGSKKHIRFRSELSASVGEFSQKVNMVPHDRRSGFWKQSSGVVQKWVQEELIHMGYVDQRFKCKKFGSELDMEFLTQDLTTGLPIETIGKDTCEVVLQAFLIALKDLPDNSNNQEI